MPTNDGLVRRYPKLVNLRDAAAPMAPPEPQKPLSAERSGHVVSKRRAKGDLPLCEPFVDPLDASASTLTKVLAAVAICLLAIATVIAVYEVIAVWPEVVATVRGR